MVVKQSIKNNFGSFPFFFSGSQVPRFIFSQKEPSVMCWGGGVYDFDSIPDLALGADHVFALVFVPT